ncbi:MAG: PAS domain S-box protein [Ignavibacteriales bacterium]|nr:PAS domain S-box protein [Ignavibacteriales bacterium]
MKHRLLFEHANDGVLVLRGESVIDCNPRALELFGCERKDLLGQSLYAFSPPHQLDGSESKFSILARIHAALHEGPQRFTWKHVRRDGNLFEAEVRLNRFELENETLLQAQVRDITAELEAQEELARSEEKYRQLVLEAGDPILVMDGNGKIVEANEKACVLLRTTREEILHTSVAALSPLPLEEALADYRKLYAHLIEKGQIATAGQFLKRKDGTQFPYEMSAVLLGNGLLQSIIRDISEKKRAEQEVDKIYALATTLRGRELFEKSAAGLAELLDMDYVIVGETIDKGSRIRSLTFYARGTIERQLIVDVAGTPYERILTEKKTRMFGAGVTGKFKEAPHLQERNIESFIGAPMTDSNREVIGVVAAMSAQPHRFLDHEQKIMSIIVQRLASELDMLSQRKREEQLSQQLLQSQKMESLGTLAGGVAHDFNNILGAVIGYTSLVKKQIDPKSQSGRYLEAIEKSAQRAASLSKQLLSFSHKTHGDIRPVSINNLIEDTIHIISSSFPKRIAVKTEFSESLPPVLGDQNQLGQVIMNLCINARDAIEEPRESTAEGLLTITTTHFEAGAGFVDVHLSAAPGQYVCITVRDNGAGMTQEVRQRIFEPFFTTKGKGRGTGLGLSMVYGIVRNHGGFIDVFSESGKGTEIKIFLPGAETMDEQLQTAVEEELPYGNGEVVMVVDDEPMLRELVADVLAGQGYKVVLAANGKEAVELYKQEQNRIRLVILDMIMPEMDGQATFQALKTLNPEIKVLISSGFSQDSSVQVLLHSGAAGFVGKPYQTEDLLKAVSNHLKN